MIFDEFHPQFFFFIFTVETHQLGGYYIVLLKIVLPLLHFGGRRNYTLWVCSMLTYLGYLKEHSPGLFTRLANSAFINTSGIY